MKTDRKKTLVAAAMTGAMRTSAERIPLLVNRQRCQETIPRQLPNLRQVTVARLLERLNPPLHRLEVALFERRGQRRSDRI